jgi:hypothetical protein
MNTQDLLSAAEGHRILKFSSLDMNAFRLMRVNRPSKLPPSSPERLNKSLRRLLTHRPS